MTITCPPPSPPPAIITTHTNKLYTLDHLAVIEASGDDIAKFLQGQLTCDINELTEAKATVAAFCSPKGRVISTLLLVKSEQRFLLLLPSSLLDKVLNGLRKYVLRAKVALQDKRQALRLLGLYCPDPASLPSSPTADFQIAYLNALPCIKLPSPTPRFLCLADEPNSASFVDTLQQQGFVMGDATEWRYQDISAGFPWFDAAQSEHFIPQMLDIDRLGGISFNKGCYTGQEIIARTHYLGKAKRQLFLAECNGAVPSDSSLEVVDATNREKFGDILAFQHLNGTTRLLIVLQTVDKEAKNLILGDSEQTSLTLIPYQ